MTLPWDFALAEPRCCRMTRGLGTDVLRPRARGCPAARPGAIRGGGRRLGARGRHARMGSIGRYIFRTTLGAFLVVLASVTMLMWMTQALRNVDLMTNQGQTILV